MNMRKLLLFCVIPLFLQIGVSGEPTDRTLSVNYAGETRPLNEMPTMCVGAGRANEGLRADWQQQLAETVDDCGFRYLRFHGLLCDDMGVYHTGRDGKPIYNWQYIDALFDAMLDVGIRPFVELGFMPSGLASGSQTIFWWKGNITPPNDYEKWAALIRALITHWTERYGEDEVVRWYFEVWNEPNLTGFWMGNKDELPYEEWAVIARAEYFKLYQITAEAVKSVNPRYRVGGPATAGNAWIPETIGFCANNNAPIDFITTHHYGVDSGFLDEWGNHGTVLAPNGNTISDAVKHSREQMQESEMKNLGLHYTEWSTSYTPSDPVHDSYVSAAYILHNLKSIGDAAQSMSYWTFTDIFEESGPRYSPFHGGFGLTNYQGIHKPAYYAFSFFNQLGSSELVTDDTDSWICKDANGGLQALVWDFTLTRPGDNVNNQDFFNKDLPADPAEPLKLHVEHMNPGLYQLKAYKVGYRSNDAYTAYIDMSSPQQLTREQVKILKSASSGNPFVEDRVSVGEDGILDATFAMLRNDVVLLVYEKI